MARPFTRRGILAALALAALVALGGAVSLRGQEPAAPLAPEFQLFLNARADIAALSIHRHRDREIVAGALRGLAREVGPKFAAYFPKDVPPATSEAMVSYERAVRAVATSEEGRAAGFTLKVLVEKSIGAYCRSLDDYSDYTSEAIARHYAAARVSEYVGVGLTFRRQKERYICTPFAGGAADQAGVSDGDELLAIDDQPTKPMTMLEVSHRLSGEVGKVVRLKVKHSDGVIEEVTPRRVKIRATPVTTEITADGVRIGLRRIDAQACKDVRLVLHDVGPKAAIWLDLRGCPGGDYEPACNIAELFLPEDVVVAKLETVRGTEKKKSGNKTPYRPKRLVILQDETTASGAELIITALLSHNQLRAESRGTRTYGKGVTTRDVDVVGGGRLRITDSRIYGPQDEFWDGEGLAPTSSAAPGAP